MRLYENSYVPRNLQKTSYTGRKIAIKLVIIFCTKTFVAYCMHIKNIDKCVTKYCITALHYFDKVSLLQNCSEYKNEFDNNVAYNVITYITITITYGVAFYEDYEILITKVKYVRISVCVCVCVTTTRVLFLTA